MVDEMRIISNEYGRMKAGETLGLYDWKQEKCENGVRTFTQEREDFTAFIILYNRGGRAEFGIGNAIHDTGTWEEIVHRHARRPPTYRVVYDKWDDGPRPALFFCADNDHEAVIIGRFYAGEDSKEWGAPRLGFAIERVTDGVRLTSSVTA